MYRREVVTGASVLGVASLAGCLGVLDMDEHNARPAGVDRSVLDETGYDQTAVEELGIEEEFDMMLYTESVSVRNYLTEHEKAVDLGPVGDLRAAVFIVITTPQVSIAGREFNPVEELSTEDLVELVSENYGEIDIHSEGDEWELDVLDQTTTVGQFEADAEFEGEDLDVLVHVAEAVETDDDHVISVGVYPEETRGQETDNVDSLMQAIIEDAHDH